MKVAILTLFKNLSPTYSLVHVVRSQARMLLAAGYEVTLFVSELFEPEDGEENIDSRKKWEKTRHTHLGLMNNSDVDTVEITKIAEGLKDKLKEISLCFVHDIFYHEAYYLHNLALREVQPQLPNLRFIVFTHSYPLNRPIQITGKTAGYYTPMPNTRYAYPTRSGIEALAHQYSVPEGRCYVVYHGIPLIEEMTEVVQTIHHKVDLLSPDIVIVAPARLTEGKQLEKIVQLAGAMRIMGEVSVRVISGDFATKDTLSEAYKHTIKVKGAQYGLGEQDVVFTSDLGYEKGMDHESILELFALSNIYVCPSKSETFSLTAFEAASKGNILVLNENVPALKEIGEELGAYFMKWDARLMGRDILQTYEEEEATYYGFHAKRILQLLASNNVIKGKTKVRQRFSESWIWYNQLAPLIEEAMLYK